jgi:hypothetical protein
MSDRLALKNHGYIDCRVSSRDGISKRYKCKNCGRWLTNHSARLYHHTFQACTAITKAERIELAASLLPLDEVQLFCPPKYRSLKRDLSEISTLDTDSDSACNSHLEEKDMAEEDLAEEDTADEDTAEEDMTEEDMADEDMAEENTAETIAKQREKRINEWLCDMLVTCNRSFDLLDDDNVRQFFMDEFDYELPSASMLSSTILPQIIADAGTSMGDHLKEAYFATMSSDTWCLKSGKAVFANVAALCGGIPAYLGAVYSRNAVRDSQCKVSLLERCINSHHSGRKLAGIVTDNSSATRESWALLQKMYPKALIVGCHAQMLNLFFSDVFTKEYAPPGLHEHSVADSFAGHEPDDFPTIQQHEGSDGWNDFDPTGSGVTWASVSSGKYTLPQLAFIAHKLTVFFSMYQIASDALEIRQKELNLKALQMPGETRWASILRCISRVYDNRVPIVSLIRDGEQVRQQLKLPLLLQIVDEDETVWEAMKMAIDALTPLSSMLTVIESNNCDVSAAFHFLHEYEEFLRQSDLAKRFPGLCEAFKQRKAKLYGVRIAFAYSLDLRYGRKHLTAQYRRDIIERIQEHCPVEVKLMYDRFCSLVFDDNDREIGKHWNRSHGDILRFWDRMKLIDPSWEPLCTLASRLLSVICNAASAERMWSNFGSIILKNSYTLSKERAIELSLAYAWKAANKTRQTAPLDMSTFCIFKSSIDDEAVSFVPSYV